MNGKKENHYCEKCARETSHFLVIVRKKSEFEGDEHQGRKEYIYGFLKGLFFGGFLASMDDLSRHLICEVCGNKIVED